MTAGLAGCADSTPDIVVQSPGASARPAGRPDISPSGATVAFASVDGAPPAIVERFSAALRNEATTRRLTLVESATANYVVRGYLSAYPAENGTAVGYVWDVFDGARRRAQRVEDTLVVKGAAADPWSLVDDKVLASVAARSADDLAAFLSTTPEAGAAARAPSGNVALATPASAKLPALGFASAR